MHAPIGASRHFPLRGKRSGDQQLLWQAAARLAQALRWLNVRALLLQVSSRALQRWRQDFWPGRLACGPNSPSETHRHTWD
jgi:hypothetical protein